MHRHHNGERIRVRATVRFTASSPVSGDEAECLLAHFSALATVGFDGAGQEHWDVDSGQAKLEGIDSPDGVEVRDGTGAREAWAAFVDAPKIEWEETKESADA